MRTEHAGRRVCDGLRSARRAPVPGRRSTRRRRRRSQDLRAALDTYGDLLVADAVHHLVEGRADIAGQVMDAAAGLSRPPELSLLRTARDGRAVASSVVLALPHLPGAALPAAAGRPRARLAAATLDPSVAAYLAARHGAASEWDFVVGPADTAEPPSRSPTSASRRPTRSRSPGRTSSGSRSRLDRVDRAARSSAAAPAAATSTPPTWSA